MKIWSFMKATCYQVFCECYILITYFNQIILDSGYSGGSYYNRYDQYGGGYSSYSRDPRYNYGRSGGYDSYYQDHYKYVLYDSEVSAQTTNA